MRDKEFYEQSYKEAIYQQEQKQYYNSYRRNVQCAEDIQQAINRYYDGYRLQKECIVEVQYHYSRKRIYNILAYTILHFYYDGRISHECKDWAARIYPANCWIKEPFIQGYLIGENPGLIGMFTEILLKVEH